MNKKFVAINIRFEDLVKAIIIVAVIIATIVIIYSFNYIFSTKKNSNDISNESVNIDELINLSEYSACYDVYVNSNKTKNKYLVCEYSNFYTNEYRLSYENGIEIYTKDNVTRIINSKTNKDYINENNNIEYNTCSLVFVIDALEHSKQESFDDKILVLLPDNKIIAKIEIVLSKDNSNIDEIKMYKMSEDVVIVIDNISFSQKK